LTARLAAASMVRPFLSWSDPTMPERRQKTNPSRPPALHQQFVRRFPRLAEAWDLVNEEGAAGPLDAKTQRLVKLAIAIGALREGAVHSGVRKARDAGATPAEMEQVVALAASTIGLPAAVAAWSWVKEEAAGRKAPRKR
jgi:4-carboxymuconolactone decarboxylase